MFSPLLCLQRFPAILGAGIAPFLLASCALVPGETRVPSAERIRDGSVHYHRAREQGKVGLKKLNPVWWLGNADEDYDPNWKPDKSHEWRKFTYALRNPGHNFTHYVIGVADRDFVRYGLDPDQIWNQEGRVNRAMIHAGPLRLPFYSRQGRHFDQYIGWRESGNFGIAFRKAHAPDRGFPKKEAAPSLVAQPVADVGP